MPVTTTQKQKNQVDQGVQEEDDTLQARRREDSIEESIPPDTIVEVLEDTATESDVSNSEKEEDGGHELADVASRVSSALKEKED
ncbi:MAG: hypothetical protein ACI8RZ_007722 [Myxococcota bacterium]|jgi:hypothetical protein